MKTSIFTPFKIPSLFLIMLLLGSMPVWAQAPTLPPSNLNISNIDGNRFFVNFTRGDGDRRIIVASTSPVTATPIDGADYLAGDFGQGNEISPGQFVVYNGTSNQIWINGLNHSTTYYFKIFEYNGSNFTTEYLVDQFLEGNSTTLSPPTTQASNLTFSNIAGTTMTVNWDGGDGNGRILIARAGSPVEVEPQDLVNYNSTTGAFGTTSTIYNIGTPEHKVLYVGGASSANITSLSPNTTYHFAVFEYNGNNGKVYLRPGSSANQLTASAPTEPAFNFSVSNGNVDGDRFFYSYTRGNGARRVIIAKEGSPVTALPEDGLSYTASTTFGSGQEISTGEYVVYDGTAASSWLYGLQPNTTYHLAVFEYNGSGADTFYLTDPFLSGSRATLSPPTTQASNLTFSNIAGTTMTVNWVGGDGNGRILIARAGSPVEVEPQDLINYNATTGAFGTTSTIYNIGTPEHKVLYVGGASSANITSLSPNTTYHFAIFEYTGNNGKQYLRPGLAASQLTSSAPTEAASNFSVSSGNVDGDRFFYSYTRGNGARRVIIAKAGSPVTALPEDGLSYSASTTFGSGQEISTGEYVVYDGTAASSWLYGLQPNTTYHLAVFEYNGSGADTFYLTDPFLSGSRATLSPPSTQASNLTFSNIAGTTMTVNWVGGDGNGRILIARAGSPVEVEPQDLVNYNATTGAFGTTSTIYNIGTPEHKVLYVGGASSANITSLSPNTTYHFAIFEYTGNNGKQYLRPGLAANQLTSSAPTEAASNFSVSSGNVDGDRFFYSLTRGNGARRVIIAKAGSPVTALPEDGLSYTASTTFGSGQEISTGEYLVYDGTAASSWLYGLQPNTTYHLAVFEYNGSGADTFYLTDPFLSGSRATLGYPTVQSNNAFTSSRSNNSINISWTRGDGSRRILIGRKDGPVNVEPQDFTNYNTTSIFETGSTQIGTDNYGLYAGTGNNINVTNLEPSTNYHFALFEYNGSNAKLYLRPGYQFALETFGERPTEQTSNASYTNIDFNSFDVSFNPGNGTRRLVLARAGSPVNAGPSDFTSYEANNVFGEGDQIGTGNFLVYNDFGTNFSLLGLEQGVTYHLAFFEYTISEQGELYLAPAYTSSQITREDLDLALSAVLSPESDCNLGESETIEVQITNNSSTPVEAFSLAYSINGSVPVIEALAGEGLISGNGSLNYTFIQTTDLSSNGIYEISAYLILLEDVDSSNDELTVVIENFADPVTTITENLSIIEGESILLEATGGSSYLWNTNQTSASITVQPEVTTEYSVLITDENGCSVQQSVTVEVIPDLCADVECPPGNSCLEGQCIPHFVQVSGIVEDFDTQEPLNGVLVSNGSFNVLTDENGFYALDAQSLISLNFSLQGYIPSQAVVQEEPGAQEINIALVSQCSEVVCPPGFSCYQGGCFDEFYLVSGTVRDELTNEPLVDVLVSSATLTGLEEVLTDENGTYTISVSYESLISFTKVGYVVFTSDPILEATTSLDVLLEPTDDLCSTITCPPGYTCLEGGCFLDSYTVSGTVRDADSNEPIVGVAISSIVFSDVQVFSDENGAYSILVSYPGIVTFAKEGYEIFNSEPILSDFDGLDVLLLPIVDLCEGVTCQPGEICYQGSCFEFSEVYTVSGTVTNSSTGTPLGYVKVSSIPEGTSDNSVFTDSNGFYSISVLEGEQLKFERATYDAFTSQPIVENTTDFDVALMPNCESFYCPIGQSCFQGECYFNCSLDQDCPPGTRCTDGRCLPIEEVLVTGVVRDLDSNLPLENVSVGTSINPSAVLTDVNGYFEITIFDGDDLLFFLSDYNPVTITSISIGQPPLAVFLQYNPGDPCEDLYCPIGQSCVNGECRQACSVDTDCPEGTFCVGGNCLPIEELCWNTNCPEGSICLDGRCISEDDPCIGSTCPEGSYCLDGDCIIVNNTTITISGFVKDKVTGANIPGVVVNAGYKSVVSQTDGSYSIKIPFGFSLDFSRWDYLEFNSPPMVVNRSNYTVELYKNWCLVHDCQPGQQCVNGRCETIFYTVSGTVRDELTNEPIPNATVFTPGSETQTNEIGAYSIQVILNNAIQFSKEGFSSQQSPNISADNSNYNVLLGPDPCESISCESGFKCENGECVPDPCATSNCQPDELCFNGSCFPYPDLTIYGTVKDINTGDPIAAAAVVNSNPTLVDYNGYFIVQVPFGDQILFIAEGYQWEYSPVMTQDFALLEIFMTPDAECDDIVCPDGKICNNGICIDPCSDLDCPPGYACLGGQCFQVDCTSSLTALQVSPTIGTSDTEYTFTITYTDPSNAHLLVGYPRLELDANNNGSSEDPGDLMLAMTEIDPSDLDFTDGKIYQVTVSGLSDNTTWKARVVTKNEFNCQISTEFINEPNVSVSNLDVAIFANNITFTNDTPNTDEAITMFARVRNISDFPADNFIVSAYDGETQIFTTTVDNLEANSNIDLSWVYSFAEPGFYPIRVVIDETNVLDEINELNNFAIRPVIVGNYVLPGGIQATAAPNTTTVYVGDWINISGYASYFGIDEGINPDVAGANVSFIYENGTFQTTTSSNGTYSRSLNMPSVPGVYTFTGAVTDYTLTGEIPSFQVEVIPLPDKADLKASITLDQSEVVEGEEITGVATVTNIGELTATNFTFRYSSCEGVLGEVDINSMAPGETLSFNFAVTITDEIGSCLNKNNCSFIAIADVYNEVDDRSRSNNTAIKTATIYPNIPDLTPALSSISGSSTMVNPFNFSVRVDNIAADILAESFNINVYVDNVLIDTRSFDNLERCDKISYPLTVEFDTQEDHEIRIKVDEPLGSGNIEEFNEDNNEFIRLVRYNPPPELKPNLYITKTYLSVDPGLPVEGENFVIKARVRNTGQAPIQEAFDVNFQITEDGVPRNETLTVSEGLAANAELLLQYETSLATYGNHAVLVDLDPLNLIDETIEFDNKASMPLCVDFEVGQSGSVWNGGFIVDTEQNLSGRVRNLGLFTATNVRVDFLLDGSEIGSTIIPELSPTYNSIGMLVSIPYTFRDVGTHQLEMVVDRNDLYIECDETNNAIAKDIVVRAPQPDLRILSEYIAPTSLNPELDEEINMFISYENIGANTTLPFKIRVTVDDVPLGDDIVVDGLGAGQLATVPVVTPYSSSTSGVKVIRGFVDVDQEADDVTYSNNEASRAVVVGAAPNLLFTEIDFSTYCPEVGELVQINVEIENEGDLGADAEVHFYYVTENNTVPIDMVPITTDLQSSTSASITYTVINPEYKILAEIKNSTIQEFNDLDNAILGEFVDTIAPNLSIPADLTINKDEVSCEPIELELGAASANDNCSNVTIFNNAPEFFPIGETEVIWTAIDASGNTTVLIQLVTITLDGEGSPLDTTITQVSGVLTSNQTGATYQWYQCPDNILPDETNQSFIPTEDGNYKVEIILGDCTVESDCITVEGLSIEDVSNPMHFAMYPNPANDLLYINSDFEGVFTIINQIGQVVQTFKVRPNMINIINVKNLSDGVYYVKGTDVLTNRFKKLIIKK